MQSEKEFKITVLGAGGVGKSALTIRLITGGFEANYDPTIEDTYRKQVGIDGEEALMDILDTAGQEEYAALQDQWIREGDGFVLVYSVDNPSTFEECEVIRQKIIRILDKDPDNPNVAIVLAGNKCDLPEKERKVTTSEGQKKVNEWKAVFHECSAKNNINVEEAFYDCVREIRKRRNPGGKKAKTGGGKGGLGGLCTLL